MPAPTPTLKNNGQTAAEVAELNGNLEAAQAIMVLATAKSAASAAPAAPPSREHKPMKRAAVLRGFRRSGGGHGVSRGSLLCRCRSSPPRISPRRTSNKAVEEVIAERSKDGAFVFHDPKLDADLNLVFEQIKIVRGMEGYGWFANAIFHDKDEPKKQYAIDFWFKPEGDKLTLMDIRVQKGPKQDGDSWYHGHAHAGRLVVAARAGASRRHGGDARLAGDERDPQLHRHATRTRMATSPIKDDKTGETCRSNSSRCTSRCGT